MFIGQDGDNDDNCDGAMLTAMVTMMMTAMITTIMTAAMVTMMTNMKVINDDISNGDHYDGDQ